MRMLVGLDLLDPNVENTLAQAVIFGVRLNASVDLAYVDGTPYAASFIHDPAVLEMLESEAEKLRLSHLERLAQLMAKVPEDHRGELHTRYHHRPSEVLCELGEHFDLLVVGTHGRQGLKHLMLGSVAERVVRNAKCPTLVLRLPIA